MYTLARLKMQNIHFGVYMQKSFMEEAAMARYIFKRIIAGILTTFVLITATFFLMHAIPGGPFSPAEEKNVPVEVLERLNEIDRVIGAVFVIMRCGQHEARGLKLLTSRHACGLRPRQSDLPQRASSL